MSPTRGLLPLLHLLLHLLQPAGVGSETSKPKVQMGKEFLVAFSEIIAQYHPTKPTMAIQATAPINDNTLTTISHVNKRKIVHGVNKTHKIAFGEDLELGKEEISNKSVQITSQEDVAVFALIQKNKSMQTLLVLPTEKLGTKYFIPAVPSIAGTTNQPYAVTMQVTERSPFRITIINTDTNNKVTVKGSREKEILLSEYEVAQVWLDEEDNIRAVEAEAPVALFFGHPCARQKECTCGQLHTMVPPAKEDESDFFIPPLLVDPGSDETVVLVTDGSGASSSKPYDKNLPVVKQASAAILYSPGMLLTLIPESDFASCYIVSALPDIPSYAVIMVKAGQTGGVRVGTTEVDEEWQDVKDTGYKTTRHQLKEGRSVIWHSYSKMAVYYIGENDDLQFGHPAPIISTSPDCRGCCLTPETLHIGDSAGGWRESLKYCLDKELELMSFSEACQVKQVNKWLAQRATEDLTELWIGMRRSSLNGEWYWANNDKTVSVTNWDQDEPGLVEEGQCAMMSRKDGDFMWRDEDCCRRAKPLCVGKGKFITE